MTDADTFALIRDRLFTAVIGDVMDAAGLTHQFLPPQIQPAAARTWWSSAAPCPFYQWTFSSRETRRHRQSAHGENPSASCSKRPRRSQARRDLSLNTGSSPRNALWGELMSTRAIKLGAAGAVLDGYTRDTHGVLPL